MQSLWDGQVARLRNADLRIWSNMVEQKCGQQPLGALPLGEAHRGSFFLVLKTSQYVATVNDPRGSAPYLHNFPRDQALRY